MFELQNTNHYLPAVILPHAEGILDIIIPSPIPNNSELIQFIGMPLKEYKLFCCEKKYIFPYNALKSDNSKSSQTTLGYNSCDGLEWSPSYLQHLKINLRNARPCYTKTQADQIYTHMLSAAKMYLL